MVVGVKPRASIVAACDAHVILDDEHVPVRQRPVVRGIRVD